VSAPPAIRIALRFTGRVQGVGFRRTAEMIALRLGLSGWVRNEPDGSVRCEAQGPRGRVEDFLSDLLETMGGRIDGVERQEIPAADEPEGFRVRHAPLGR
jgi:acylphosphatase